MNKQISLVVALVLAAGAVVVSIQARDGSCLATDPPQCSRSFGWMSIIYLGLGVVVVWL